MNRKLNIFLSILLLLQMSMPLGEVNAAALTKPMTHTITQSYWSSDKSEGPSYYDYDDGLWYGRLYKTSTTWKTRRGISTGYWTMYSDNSPIETFNTQSYYENYYNNRGYSNVDVSDIYWTSETKGPGEYVLRKYDDNGNLISERTYKYIRNFSVRYSYDEFKYSSTYTGTVKLRTIPPEMRLSDTIFDRYHNQDKIQFEGFVKDEDMGDINTIYYSIVGTSHNNKNPVLTNRAEIVATGNEEYFTGYIQLDQSISPGEYKLKLWAADDKGAESSIIEVPITIYNLLEDILNNLQKYTFKDLEELQFIVINSNTSVSQSAINDDLIIKIKKELKDKNILMYFIGNEESKNYINSSLLDN